MSLTRLSDDEKCGHGWPRNDERCPVCYQTHAECMVEAKSLAAERDALKAEVERLSGLRPKWPPMQPDGEWMPRYGLRWNGPTTPVAVPMDDGYWTPWHLAQGALAAVVSCHQMGTDSACLERQACERYDAHATQRRLAQVTAELERVAAQRDEALRVSVSFASQATRAEDELEQVAEDVEGLRAELERVAAERDTARELANDALQARDKALACEAAARGLLADLMRDVLSLAGPGQLGKEAAP